MAGGGRAGEAERLAAEGAVVEQAEAEHVPPSRRSRAGRGRAGPEPREGEAERVEAERAAAEQVEGPNRQRTEAAASARRARPRLADVPQRLAGERPVVAAQAASMLTELNREAGRGPAPPAARSPRRRPCRRGQAEKGAGPEPMVTRDHADTAMLLRELSSLGFGTDDDAPPPPGAGARADAPPSTRRKKKRAVRPG